VNAQCLTFGEWVEDLLDTNIESVSMALDLVNIGKSSETHCHARNVGVNDTLEVKSGDMFVGECPDQAPISSFVLFSTGIL
jgi:hypothetical protein